MSLLYLAAMAVGGTLLYRAGVAQGQKIANTAPPVLDPKTKQLNGFG